MDHESAAAQQWARELADWRIPDDILVACPDSPWTFPTALFTEMAHAALAEDTPSRRRAEEALPPGGSVLDVGCGAGAAGLPLTSTAQLLIGVDQSPDMLQSFAEASARIGMEHRELQGRWPDIAGRTPAADVAVCHHMLYNVADLVPFVLALADHARRRVVIEMTERHPQSALNDLWQHFHGLIRPDRPTAGDAIATLAEAGIRAGVDRFTNASRLVGADPSARAAFVRRRLCLPAERLPEIVELLERRPEPGMSDLVTLRWDVS